LVDARARWRKPWRGLSLIDTGKFDPALAPRERRSRAWNSIGFRKRCGKKEVEVRNGFFIFSLLLLAPPSLQFDPLFGTPSTPLLPSPSISAIRPHRALAVEINERKKEKAELTKAEKRENRRQ
jgi:hypothetical protein